MSNFKYVGDFAVSHSAEWHNIYKGEELANSFRKRIIDPVLEREIPLFSTDVDLVVFGSIARKECSIKSDIDWTLLVDGQANAGHSEISRIIRGVLESAKLQKPGDTGMFGQTTFSHDLINYIGGKDDTNHNLSRRALLLLESDNIIFNSEKERFGTAYDRVIRGIINQYISNDSSFSSERGKIANVPRFLLNDFIRFWRTMCVDFAYKQKEQKDKKWALRNIKLRMSRKLIFVKGLLMCFSCYNGKTMTREELIEHIRNLALMKPLDVVIFVLKEHKIEQKWVVSLFEAYDKFLELLNNEEKREHLSNLNVEDVYADSIFMGARKISDDFQRSLFELFINQDSVLKEFTLKYGIF